MYVRAYTCTRQSRNAEQGRSMGGLISAMEGFCVIGIVIAAGYVTARLQIGGAQDSTCSIG